MMYGEHLSRLKVSPLFPFPYPFTDVDQPRTILIIFILCDLTNLILQAAGGAISSTALEKSRIDIGIDVIIAGLTTQAVSLFIFMAMCGEFAMQVKKRKGEMVERHRTLRETRLWKGFLFGKPSVNSEYRALLTEMSRSCSCHAYDLRS